MENNNFLLLDEPTNHLDIDSKEVLEEALIDYDGTILFVSHDRYFINRVATKVLEIEEIGSSLFLGDYDYYVEKKAELEEIERLKQVDTISAEIVIDSVNDYQLQKENQKEIRKLQRRLLEVEEELEGIEVKIEDLQDSMLSTNDPQILIDSQFDLDQLIERQETLMEEWENLSLQLEE